MVPPVVITFILALAALPALAGQAPAVFTMSDVLQKHALWLRTNGVQGVKADLRGINLEGARGKRGEVGEVLAGRVVLTGVDLRQADFRDAKLRNVDFTG